MADSDGVGAAEMNLINVCGSWIRALSADRQQVKGGFDRGSRFLIAAATWVDGDWVR
ncbi:hypothetical protein C1H46_017871 [Malus baccata]|uniref:Uncharacterized protein n=1 Tax=Malus baccata TaxID=106549 RepID=A0A540MCQ7_MALBA|nr:hypothetical protein C1H46_017871 [Malus baccata]